jgi:tetratricopeptide (TPR) repeat protein
MKKSILKSLSYTFIAVVGLSGCSGLGKFVKNADKITYKVTPDPMEMHGDSVVVKITGTYPAKMFPKKATVTVTPVIKYNGGEKTLKPVVMVGEKSEAKGQKIAYDKGGNFSYTSDKVAYSPEMKVSTLALRCQGQVKSKTKDVPEKKVADGMIVTPLLVKNDEKPIYAKDNFVKTIPRSFTGEIFFLINTSNVRETEMKSDEMKAFKDFIDKGVAKHYAWKGASISAYASPDGEMSMNANLAEDRAKSTLKSLVAYAKEKNKDKTIKFEAGSKDEFYTKATTAEDWDGFKKAMEASNIKDKDLVLRVLTMYSDVTVREKEIKNLSATYTEIKDKILPKLRRSVITLNADENSRTDAQISALVMSSPDSLSVEEILYAASLTNDLNAKLDIYKKAESKYGNDWRTSNNVGYIYILQNKLNEAEAEFKKADVLSANNPAVKNNLGICAHWRGDRKAAMDFYKAAGSAPEPTYNSGIIEIQNGNYAAASSDFGSENTFNAALAKLLNGNNDGAMQTLDASKDKDGAMSYYLKAVASARMNKADAAASNLKAAIQKDASLKQMAKDDAEFIKIRDNAGFKEAVN